MQENKGFTHNIDVLFSNLEEFTKKESVMGKPITHGDKTLIPIVSVTIGYGSGNNRGQMGGNPDTDQQGASMGMGALGLGARISTDAVVVIDKDNVTMLPTNEKSNLSSMMDKLPQMLSGMGIGNQQGQQGQQGQQAQQWQQGQQGSSNNQKS